MAPWWLRARIVPVAFVLGVVAAPAPARAEPPSIDQCVTLSTAGQRDRDRGAYVAARQAFLRCADPACPVPIARDCTRWLEDMERVVPSIIVSVRDAEGHDVFGAKASIDGAPAEPVQGRPITIDPGEHLFAAEAPGHETHRERLVVLASEKNRIVILRVERSPSATPAATAEPMIVSPSLWPVTFGLGGLGLVALGASVILGTTARSDLADARSSPCAATASCDEATGRSIDDRLLAADVLLGVGVVALAGAAVWFFTHRPHPARPAASAR